MRLITGRFIAGAIREVWVGCNMSNRKMKNILKASFPYLKEGVNTLSPANVRDIFCKLRDVFKKRVKGNRESLMILCYYAKRKHKKLLKERMSQGVINNFMGTNIALPDRASLWGQKERSSSGAKKYSRPWNN